MQTLRIDQCFPGSFVLRYVAVDAWNLRTPHDFYFRDLSFIPKKIDLSDGMAQIREMEIKME